MKQAEITALVLAGGRGSRMGGIDKGWAEFNGVPLITHLLARLVPQVSDVIINANRTIDRYQALCWPVVQDTDPSAFDGPLAGMLVGLKHCRSEWLLTAPCDSPFVPRHYAERMLAAARKASARIAMASDGSRHQPVFCLLKRDLVGSLQQFLDNGDRKIDLWTRANGAIELIFDEPDAFTNFNTLEELQPDTAH